jgi:UDP-N-acetylmuramate: L-alanyl-gamma-D-glutamyl-meso-diaminopimelate ligase
VLQNELAKSLALADEVVVASIFKSEAIPEAERLDLIELAADVQRHGKRARIVSNADGIVQLVAPEMRSGDVVAILSNGGFDGIYEKLPERLKAIGAGRVQTASAASREHP